MKYNMICMFLVDWLYPLYMKSELNFINFLRNKGCCLLRCNAVYYGRSPSTFLRNILPPSHVRWDPCPHSMARSRVADGGTASKYGG
jgi:hypothetical protein